MQRVGDLQVRELRPKWAKRLLLASVVWLVAGLRARCTSGLPVLQLSPRQFGVDCVYHNDHRKRPYHIGDCRKVHLP